MRHEILWLIALSMPFWILGEWIYIYKNVARRRTHLGTTIFEHAARHLLLLSTMAIVLTVWPWPRVGHDAATAIRAAFVLTLIRLGAFVAGAWRRRLSCPSRSLTVRSVSSAVMALLLVSLVVYGHAPCPAAGSIAMNFPLEQTWYVFQGGPTVVTNLHHLVRTQRYAVDLVRVGSDGLSYRGSPKTLTSFYAWSRPVYAPVAGTVVSAARDYPDSPPGQRDKRDIRGNHVVIETADGTEVLLAHLQQGSVVVEGGTRLRQGQFLGRVGNSGNTSEPHLHLGAVRKQGNDRVGIPFVISDTTGHSGCLRKDQPLVAQKVGPPAS